VKLSDVMGASGQQIFAEIGLVLFLALFAGVLVYLFARGNQATFERARSLPLDDERGSAPGEIDR
jgi:cbb3-type cytochrome oxidase subunit 3